MWAGVVVDYDGDNHIEGDGEGLHENEGFGEVAGIFKFGAAVEESHVAGYVFVSNCV